MLMIYDDDCVFLSHRHTLPAKSEFIYIYIFLSVMKANVSSDL